MFPSFEILGKTIGIYSLIALFGAFLCGTLFCILIRKKGLDDNEAIAFLLFIALGAIIGGHFLYGIINRRYLILLMKSKNFSEVFNYLFLMFGGSVFYGGLLGSIVAGLIVFRVMRLNSQVYLDCMAPIAPLFHGIARIGCFFGGCCYGIESSWGVAANGNPYIPEINCISRFPVQLLESAGNFLIFAFLFYLLKIAKRKQKLNGKLIYIYFLSYSTLRFFDEFLRGDVARGFVGIFSTSQIISMLLFFAVLLILTVKHKTTINQSDCSNQ